MHQHFSKVSARYNEIRTTDLEPIMFIQERCNNNQRIEAVDIGAGSGRYCLKLFDTLQPVMPVFLSFEIFAKFVIAGFGPMILLLRC